MNFLGGEAMRFCPNCGKEISEGVTFCPESIRTEMGEDLLKNFLSSHTVSTTRGATTCQL